MARFFQSLLCGFALTAVCFTPSGVAAERVCDRSPLVVEQLQHETSKPCEHITESDLNQLDYFQIGFNPELFEVKTGDLRGLPGVRYLYFNCNPNLESVPSDLIDGMAALEVLAVHSNPKLTTLPEQVFASLQEQTHDIMMMDNGLTQLPESFFTHFSKRKSPAFVYLDGNSFSPETLTRIQKLFGVELGANGDLPQLIRFEGAPTLHTDR